MDQTQAGTNFRILTLIDEFTREFLTVHVAWSIRAEDVITVVEAAMERYGRPRPSCDLERQPRVTRCRLRNFAALDLKAIDRLMRE